MATDMLYVGNFNDEKYLKEWVQDKCLPLVREITFENAEVSLDIHTAGMAGFNLICFENLL